MDKQKRLGIWWMRLSQEAQFNNMNKIQINYIEETVCTLFYRNEKDELTRIGTIERLVQLNDVRLQIQEKKLTGYEIHWYDEDYRQHILIIDADGKLSYWPNGFYDLLDKQLDKLTSF